MEILNYSNEMDALNHIGACLRAIACALTGDPQTQLSLPVTLNATGAGLLTLPALFGYTVTNTGGSAALFNGITLAAGATESVNIYPGAFADGISYNPQASTLRITYFPVS